MLKVGYIVHYTMQGGLSKTMRTKNGISSKDMGRVGVSTLTFIEMNR